MTAEPTVAELRKCYPNCMQAIGYVEMFLCIPPEGQTESGWELLTKPVKGVTPNPREVIEYIRKIIHSEIGEPDCGVPVKVLEDIMLQIQTPKFYTYIKGKLGAL